MKWLLPVLFASSVSAAPIDREALVARHKVTLDHPDKLAALSVGNGDFAFTADITGLQGLEEFHQDGGVPLGTESQWAWHSFPNPEKFTREEVDVPYDVNGRKIPYLDVKTPGEDSPRRKAATEWLRANPHRLDLGRLRFVSHQEGDSWKPIALADLSETKQSLDLWSGMIESRFNAGGHDVKVFTTAHPEQDAVAVRVESEWFAYKLPLAIELWFPPPSDQWRGGPGSPSNHQTRMSAVDHGAVFERTMDADGYVARLGWTGDAGVREIAPHHFVLQAAPGAKSIEFVLRFTPKNDPLELPDFAKTKDAAAAHWKDFWQKGGVIDLSGSKDKRWSELERRIVLSQYLTAIQCAGSLPPQETGLTLNSWYGKFHMEMYPLHAAQFALYQHPDLLAKSLGYYEHILPKARANAGRQGFAGARWTKMTDPNGDDSPSEIGVYLIWQQPHPILLAELLYRANPSPEILKKYATVINETATFMASYPTWDEAAKRYNLGPVLIPAQESYGRYRTTVLNPTYELAYWHWALKMAQTWRERLGQAREPLWDKVADQLARPAVRDGHYLAIETEPYLIREDHPSLLMAYGWTPPTPLIDRAIMDKTFDDTLASWDWQSTWGWDCPVVAMTAARLGRPKDAVDFLLRDTPKNGFLPNGHNWQDKRLPIYLPGNGSLLYAAAMMAAGWDGAPKTDAPGFPSDGSWTVRHEGVIAVP
ncbi:MAG: hypothetical protein ABIT37_17880 [Luteolibacter sp.]